MEETGCIICGGKGKEAFYLKDKTYNIPGKFRVVKCCDIFFLNPRPDEREIIKYYPNDYYLFGDEKEEIKMKRPLLIKASSLIFEKIIDLLFPSPIKKLSKKFDKKGFNVLEIGCGDGRNLLNFKNCNLYCTEINKVRIDKRIKIFIGPLTKARFPSAFFDLIIIHHVLEHLHNPFEYLVEVKRILKDGGMVFISIPNHNSLMAKLFRKNWIGWEAPRHLYTFSDRSLIKLLRKAKFTKFEKRHRSGRYSLKFGLKNVFGIENNDYNYCHKILITSIFLILLPIYYIIDRLSLGDFIDIHLFK